MREKHKLLLSKGFIAGLALLLLNDFVLKAAFHNELTGKLSDFAGLFIFPVFWMAFFPKQKKAIFLVTALFFIYWKSPFSQPLIDGWNALDLLSIGRVVDYSDLIALLILPLSFYYSSIQNQKPVTCIHPALLIFAASFSFIATSKYNRIAYGDYPFFSDPVKYGTEIRVDVKTSSFSMKPAELLSMMNKYNLPYLDQISNDSVFYFQAFKSSDSLPPVIKVINEYASGTTTMRISSVIFDTAQLNVTDNKRDYYKTKNATLFANNFAGWFMPEFKTIVTSDSLNALAEKIYKTYPDSAINIYKEAIEIAPVWLNAKLMLNYGLGNAIFQKRDYRQSLKYYYRADSINNQYSSYHMRAAPYYGLEAGYKKLGQKDSVKKYKKLASNAYQH